MAGSYWFLSRWVEGQNWNGDTLALLKTFHGCRRDSSANFSQLQPAGVRFTRHGWSMGFMN
jgi:hypothetical protein